MKLEKIVKAIGPAAVTGSVNRDITGITCDSRKVQAGFLFAALPGAKVDGRDFIPDALSRGAAAIISESSEATAGNACHLRVTDSRRSLAAAAAEFYEHPSGRLQIVGITGTNGKTTAAFTTRDILCAAGRSPGMLGTINYEIGSRMIPATRTTPESIDLQRMLAEMAEIGCKSAVIEVSSHSLVQSRARSVDFDVAVFTNLSHEHLDYHVTMEEYFAAKCVLFQELGGGNKKTSFAVVNADDPWGRDLLQIGNPRVRFLTFGFSAGADIRAGNAKLDTRGSEFDLNTPWGKAHGLRLSMMGRFNIMNVMAAVGACGALDVPFDLMCRTAAGCGPAPGRLEPIPTDRGFHVFVDYAHTEDALRNVLDTLRETGPRRIIVVFGCGGNRDKTKRAAMGATASRLADYCVVTSDNPRKENPEDIIAQIKEGLVGRDNYEVRVDRAEAIGRAVELAREGDIVLIAGKGHETFQEFANTTAPFDDRQVVKAAMR